MSTQANGKVKAGGTPEPELIARARAGDHTAFAALYTAHSDTVYRYLYNRTRDRNLAEDLTQDVFVRALSRLETFSAPRSSGFAGWLSTIARNIHLDYVKSARVRLESLVDDVEEATYNHDRSAEMSAMRELDIAEATHTIAAAMRDLTPYQRQCVELRFFEELTVPETAARLGKGIGAVKTLQFRAMGIMRQTLKGAAA
ncbi:RNA polymerase sigma factor [Streptomyces neyagawaensis]|uniref:RNA polymerase sigma factor n=1 Tax=Streptomyces neyagawaensis TaxID=42238 RepID=UPI0006E24976|nr:sigma-70 family RNA polymerase sigma factor [Streptomyces neyagawaensis]MCL6734431.1 sigma-70 family RNA polymerase sigma factor [Streptomyces neyagawaensis]MDE1682060.1 sigma-70 family RNA polymerase sigma factor [Streptomyces neyagawaensis]